MPSSAKPPGYHLRRLIDVVSHKRFLVLNRVAYPPFDRKTIQTTVSGPVARSFRNFAFRHSPCPAIRKSPGFAAVGMGRGFPGKSDGLAKEMTVYKSIESVSDEQNGKLLRHVPLQEWAFSASS